MKTKALVRYLNRVAHYIADVELVDIVAQSLHSIATNPDLLFDSLSEAKHPTLAKRANTGATRQQAILHLKSSIGRAHILRVHEGLSTYIRELLEFAVASKWPPERAVGEHTFNVDAVDLLKLGSWDAVTKHAAQEIVRKLENEKSTSKLLVKMDAKLDLGVGPAFMESALPYLEARHLLVHNGGKVDAKFAQKYPDLGLKADDRIDGTYSFVSRAHEAVGNLVAEFDRKFVAAGWCAPQFLQP